MRCKERKPDGILSSPKRKALALPKPAEALAREVQDESFGRGLGGEEPRGLAKVL